MKTGADFIFVGSGAVALTTRKASGIVRILGRLWEWKWLVQREEQARSPTKSEGDSADVKAYKCIQMLALRKARDSAVFRRGGMAIPQSLRGFALQQEKSGTVPYPINLNR